MLKIIVLLNLFVETMIHFFQDSLVNRNVKRKPFAYVFLKSNLLLNGSGMIFDWLMDYKIGRNPKDSNGPRTVFIHEFIMFIQKIMLLMLSEMRFVQYELYATVVYLRFFISYEKKKSLLIQYSLE